MQEPGKALAKSFSSLFGIQNNKYFSRVNLNTSCFCHSVASPPTARRQACSSRCVPTQTIQTCSHFEVSPALSRGLDKNILSDLNYSPVLSSKPGLSGHLGGISQSQHRACPARFESQWAICDSAAAEE